MNGKRLYGGAISLILGIIILAWSFGLFAMIPIGASVLSTTGQTAGISITSTIKNYPLLPEASVSGTMGISQSNYIWDITVANTGDEEWADAWFCVRMLKTTSTPVLKSHPEYGGEQFYVGKCDAGTDIAQCRENIEASSPVGWGMEYRAEITGEIWWDISDANMGDQVFCPSLGSLNMGESKSWKFKLTVPTGASGSYPIISTSGANVQGVGWIIASKVDYLNVGILAILFPGIGVALIVGGAIAIVKRRKKKR